MDTLNLKIKSVDEGDQGTFEGYLSVFGNVDLGGDVVEKGAFDKTLQERGTFPLLWQHDHKSPIGTLDAETNDRGLRVRGKLLLSVAKAREAYDLLKAGIVKGLSIGYEAVKADHKDGIRRLREVKLHEGSLVTFAMNPLATVEAVKGDEEPLEAFTRELAAEIKALLGT